MDILQLKVFWIQSHKQSHTTRVSDNSRQFLSLPRDSSEAVTWASDILPLWTSDTSHESRFLPGLWPTGYKSKVLTTPFWVQIIYYGLTELRRPVYSLDYRFVIKGYNSGKPRWKRCRRQGMEKGRGAPKPSSGTPLSPNLQVFPNPEAL